MYFVSVPVLLYRSVALLPRISTVLERYIPTLFSFFFTLCCFVTFSLCNTLQPLENTVVPASSALISSLLVHSHLGRLSPLFLVLSLCLWMIRFPDFFSLLGLFPSRAAQEYIRRQLEEEQRQLEILQQQLLQEQALLLVTTALPRAVTAPFHPSVLCCVPPSTSNPHCMHLSASCTVCKGVTQPSSCRTEGGKKMKPKQ